MRRIILFCLTFLLIILGIKTYKIIKAPQNIYPITYQFKKMTPKGLKTAQKAQVLIVGDRQAEKLGTFLPTLIKRSSQELGQPLNIYNWGRNHEGLHRTLQKLSKLETVPRLIIYHGGSEDFLEQTFHLKERENFFANLEIFNNPKIFPYIKARPWLSKFLYRHDHVIFLGPKIKKDNREMLAIGKQRQVEMGLKLFENHLKQLVDFTRKNQSELIFLTSPINMDVPPREVCLNSTTPTLENEIEVSQKMIKNGKIKSAFGKLKALGNVVMANAKIYYLLGQTLKKMGEVGKAKTFLEVASAFDCETWRANHIINNIIRKVSLDEGVGLIDFDAKVNIKWPAEDLFQDKIFPSEKEYNNLIKKLGTQIEIFFKY